MIDLVTNVTVNKIESEFLNKHGVQLFIQREDLIHPLISGNKWRKLKYNILKFKTGSYKSILTFGGTSSNHIAATAAAGKLYNIPTIGIIRGEEKTDLSYTLFFAQEQGMKLCYVNRDKYKLKNTDHFLNELKQQFPHAMIIPEGGANKEGIIGCSEITNIHQDFDYIFSACGTGSTIAGIISTLKNHQNAIGIPVLKNADFLYNDIKNHLKLLNNSTNNWHLNLDYHFGGYAKYKDELLDFIQDFYVQFQIKLDPIYTGKMMFAIFDLISKNNIKNCKVLAIHTGGLQGIPDFEKRYKKILFRDGNSNLNQ